MTFEIDGFTPLGVLGQGGFGTVHRAADDAHGREVAVKVLGRITDDSARRRFDRERRAMGTLSGHPTIGIVYTSGFTANQEPYIVMEMIRGGSLADRLERTGPLPPSEVVDLGATLAEALHHAHEGGVLHLDLKPENILMSRFGNPKIVDFGIAAIIDDEAATSTIRATPSFADPEVLNGKPGTERSDVYGLAATLFTLLHGSPPYSDGPSGLYQVMQRVAFDPVPKIERPDVSPQLASLLHRAMAKDPADRPASMDDFERQLRSVDAEPVTERRSSPRRVDRSVTPPPEPDRAARDDAASPSDVGDDRWPLAGERPRLPGAVDPSDPIPRAAPAPTPTPIPAPRPARAPTPAPTPNPPPAPAAAWDPTSVAASPAAVASASARSANDWPRHPTAATAPSSTVGRRSNTMTAVAVLTTLALVLAAVLAVVLVRRGQDDAGTSSDATIPGRDDGGPVTSVDLSARVTAGDIVPDVVGLRTGDARSVISDSGFDVEIPSHCFDTVESQSPSAGAEADASTVVSLRFAPCVVPDFVGLRLAEAERIVNDEFVVGLLISWPAHCDDVVLDQSIAAGTVVDPGTEVELTLEEDCGGG